jgi:hypothetical protein
MSLPASCAGPPSGFVLGGCGGVASAAPPSFAFGGGFEGALPSAFGVGRPLSEVDASPPASSLEPGVAPVLELHAEKNRAAENGKRTIATPSTRMGKLLSAVFSALPGKEQRMYHL